MKTKIREKKPEMRKNEKLLICVCGPTASGKTSTAIELAQHFGTEIISADSRQLYREMTIGTAVPSVNELNVVKHHFIHTHSIHDNYTAGDYAREAGGLIRELFKKRDVLILAGGTGFFVNALLYGFDEPAAKDAELRNTLNQLYAEGGIDALHERALAEGAKMNTLTDPQNPQRVIRAIEKALLPKTAKDTIGLTGQVNAKGFVLSWPREELYARIEQRVDEMMEVGLLEEVEELHPFKRLNALNTVGYSELLRHLDDELELQEAIDLIKRNTRRYAKRQMTWYRNKTAFKEVESPFAESILKQLS